MACDVRSTKPLKLLVAGSDNHQFQILLVCVALSISYIYDWLTELDGAYNVRFEYILSQDRCQILICGLYLFTESLVALGTTQVVLTAEP